jgi:NTP pyrophosphatase (non-canonical NTP hydrolase)
MINIFQLMWRRQKRHWEQDSKRYAITDPTQIHSILCLHLIREITEVLDCADWKLHRNKTPATREELLEELIDVFKFWLCLVIHNGFSPAQIFGMFNAKSDIVEKRALQEIINATSDENVHKNS